MQEFILKNLITIIFLILTVFEFVKGFSQGFVKKILSFGSIIVTIIATKAFTPTIVNMVKDVTNIESTLTSLIYDAIINTNLYDSLDMPIIKNSIDTGNLQVSIKDGLCLNLANIIINIACGIVVFIVVLLLIKLILKVLDVIDYIPVVGQLNKLLGGVFGILEFIIILWIIFTVLRALDGVPQIKVIVDNIKDSFIVGPIYNNNVVYDFLSNIFSGIAKA